MINDANSDDNDDVGGDIAITIPIMIIDHAGDHDDCCDEDAHDDDLDEGDYGDNLSPKSSPSFPLKDWESRGIIIIVTMMMISMMIVMMTPMMMILIQKTLHCSP